MTAKTSEMEELTPWQHRMWKIYVELDADDRERLTKLAKGIVAGDPEAFRILNEGSLRDVKLEGC